MTMKKLFIYSVSVIIAAVVAQLVLLIAILALNIAPTSRLHNVISGAIFVFGLIIAVYSGVIVFKKILRYLMKELGGI